MKKLELQVIIFSFNRGIYLQNLVMSVLRHLPPCKITIVDDQSDDVTTRKILDSLVGNGIRLTIPDGNSIAHPAKMGGLYRNMNLVLEELATTSRFGLLLQDDMQVVRPVSELEMFEMAGEMNKIDSPFLNLNFLKSAVRASETTLEESSYSQALGHWAFTATSLTDFEKLAHIGWEYQPTEALNSDRAMSLFGPIRVWKNPFVSFLPWPQSYRARKKTLPQAIWEKHNTGFFPYKSMSTEETKFFCSRNAAEVLPVASLFLETVAEGVKKPWRFNGWDAGPRVFRAIDSRM